MPITDEYNGQVLWDIDMWTGVSGVCYAEKDLLDDLSSRNQVTHRQLFKKMDYYRQYPFLKLPADSLEKIAGGMYELKIKANSEEIRFIGVVTYEASSPIFHVLCAFDKKSRKIPSKYIRLAEARRREFDLMKKEKKHL